MEEAAQSLGATSLQTFRRVIFPNLFPAILSGTALGFARALGEFQNVKRRMEVRGIAAGVTVYDDFAHHPTAIRETVGAARSGQHVLVLPRDHRDDVHAWRELGVERNRQP